MALMGRLKIAKADIVGWSDGGILGIDLATRHKDGVGKVFAFAPNTMTSGVKESDEQNPAFAAFIERAGHSATPKEYDTFVDQISRMWAEQPNGIGAMRSSRRSTRKSLPTATMTRRSSASTPNILRR
jgi:pimeloyl-ACP methyl ester carboxylesterase